MIDPRLWLALVAAFPVFIAIATFVRVPVEQLRAAAVVASILMLVAALATSALTGFSIQWSGLGPAPVLRLDQLSSALVPLTAMVWLVTVAVTPRAALDRGGLRRTALATLATLASFLTENAVILLVLWVVSIWIFLAALGGPEQRHQRRIVLVYHGASSVFLIAGLALLSWPAVPARVESAGMLLIVAAALIRKGIFPFHAWLPEVFDHGRLGPAILFSAPQLGAYVTLILIVPRASPEILRTVAVLALGTAVYGAALALVQSSARRACGYLFMSQSALVMAGLDCTSISALSGGLVVWLSAGLAFTGLARVVLVLEARRGRLDLGTYHGGYDRMPVLAVTFLAMGLACTGFPATLGFVGQELLVHGAIEAFPVLGFAVVLASALTGLAILRMYFALFGGRRDPEEDAETSLELTRREAWTFSSLVVVLVLLGLVPHPIVDSRFAAGEEILRQRQIHSQVGH